MKRSIKGSLFIGRVSFDSNGYPCIRFGLDDKQLFDKDKEYIFHCLGIVDTKRTTRNGTRIIAEPDF